MSDGESLGKFLADLAANPKLYAAFLKNPAGLAKTQGLSPAKLAVLRSGDLFRIRHEIEHELQQGLFHVPRGAMFSIWIWGPTWGPAPKPPKPPKPSK